MMACQHAVANRVLSVGDAGRGERVAQHFDGKKYFVHHSHRGFVVYTGRVKEVSVLGMSVSVWPGRFLPVVEPGGGWDPGASVCSGIVILRVHFK